MPLIEGVGDEVVQFVAIVLVVVVAALAWWSTNARPDRYRTVLVMRSRAQHPVTVSIRTRTSMNMSALTSTTTTTTAPTAVPEPVANDTAVVEESVTESTRVIPLQEMDSIVDADMAMVNHHRLHFYRRIDSPLTNLSASESTSDESEMQDEGEPASNAQIREMDSIVSAMEADGAADPFSRTNDAATTDPPCKDNKPSKKLLPAVNLPTATVTDTATSPESGPATESDSTGESADRASGRPDGTDARRILIKLKYLNDTLKEVEGSLDEMLKDFKWRHFSTELSAESRVRLIFNGRVLSDDGATLRACGLHHRAVVHCLVHPSRPTSQRIVTEEPALNATHELLTEGGPPERAWDLENILMTLVSVALTVVWFFRCEYSNMFTASASVALFGLTVFYSVAIFGLYLSDTFHFERRTPQPVPHN